MNLKFVTVHSQSTWKKISVWMSLSGLSLLSLHGSDFLSSRLSLSSWQFLFICPQAIIYARPTLDSLSGLWPIGGHHSSTLKPSKTLGLIGSPSVSVSPWLWESPTTKSVFLPSGQRLLKKVKNTSILKSLLSNASWVLIATCDPFILTYSLNIKFLKNPCGQSQMLKVGMCKFKASEDGQREICSRLAWNRSDRQGPRVSGQRRAQICLLGRNGAAICTCSNVCARSRQR